MQNGDEISKNIEKYAKIFVDLVVNIKNI